MFGTSLKKLFGKTKQKKQKKILPCMNAKHTALEAVDVMFNNSDEYLILDTETTGLDEDSRIVELCIMDLKGNVRYSSLFNPGKEGIRPEASVINGITEEMVADKPLFIEEINKFVHLLEGKILIAWNAPFDRKVLNRELKSVFTMPLQAEWCDAMSLYCHARCLKRERLSLAKACDIECLTRNDAHRAEGDCRDVLNVLYKVWEDR